MQHLYLHIPFCHRRCSYCDFNTYANMEHRIEAYVEALCTELRMRVAQDHVPVPCSAEAAALPPTIFFGGGTPTMLSLGQFERILEAASALVPLEGAEITSEANPGTVLGRDYLRGLRSLGINRLSMGVQSLHDPTLRVLGRIHTAAEARQSFEEAREAGFTNLNLDFIFGLPGQDLVQWEATLAAITTWGAEHFSLYSLILEEQTPLFAQVTAGNVVVPDDDAAAAMYEAAMTQFAAAGYQQYEISNWARSTPEDGRLPRYACNHNLAYWLNSDYLAVGAGAHGHLYPRRYANILGIDAYIKAVAQGTLPVATVTALTPEDLRAETMMMGLRLNQGVSQAHFMARCGLGLDEAYGPTLAHLIDLGVLERHTDRIRLTARGRMVGNQVFAKFV
ncbi:radical SAM family heme chaperone HemW [Candidatus Chloroploca asiatica]|uniref:Heme chaperone HemW n=1 Tax=Candidatus Chloroploca asiatica TaxID=1506545 RepID=A0A2H3KXL7_9CHLR|nr:radical SAM family heme chaperone HemW [Candidatus Chloroploca asiatica]PDV97111.1 coproporphyrinogen III oxidase [Candidatus Chloroploca asiatica]